MPRVGFGGPSREAGFSAPGGDLFSVAVVFFPPSVPPRVCLVMDRSDVKPLAG